MASSHQSAPHFSSLSLLATVFFLLLNVDRAHTHGAHHSSGSCEAEIELGDCYNKNDAFTLNVVAIAGIFVSSVSGVGVPLVCGSLPAMRPDRSLFVLIKTFASGVILGTAFLHVLPAAILALDSPCLPEGPWKKFPFAGLVALLAAVLTLMIDSLANAILSRRKKGMVSSGTFDTVRSGNESLQMLESTKGDPGVSHHRIIALVLEVGIVIHSVVIGLSMGASRNVCTIRSLIVALCFHQLFEGIGLGGCILQAKYGTKMKATMIFLYSITTPLGIIVGLSFSELYSDTSPTSLLVLGLLNSASAGLLICMALVDLLAKEFMGPKLQSNGKLQAWAYVSTLMGAGVMAVMAIWA